MTDDHDTPSAADRSPSRATGASAPTRWRHDGDPPVAWFHCFAGIAGDMALGSLLDAGADFDEVLALLERLPLGGWTLEVEPVLRGGLPPPGPW